MATPRTRPRQRDSTALRATATLGPSNSAHTPGPSSTTSTTTALPPYQPLTNPLVPSANALIERYARNYETSKLQAQVRSASEALTEHAGVLNAYVREREESLKKRRARREKQKARQTDENREEGTAAAGDDEGLEREAREIEELSKKVEAMTKRMEQKVMKMVDNEASVEHVKSAMKEVQKAAGGDAEASGTQATGATATQRTRGRHGTEPATASTSRTTTTLQGEGDEQADGDVASSQPPPKSLVPLLEEHIQTRNDDYQAQSQQIRYAEHQLFVGYKQEVHAERHGEDGPPLAKAYRWFLDGNEAQPGVTGVDGEDDGDFTISREHMSTRCPITALEFVRPVTCKKCRHSYEKSAIESYLAQARPPTAGSGRRPEGWRASVQCPVAGCDTSLEKGDLVEDHLTTRRIKRAQRAMERKALQDQEEGDEEEEERDGNGGRAEEIDSDSADDIDAPRELTQIKEETHKRRRQEDIEDD
ncbi:MAG: mRNA cap guanine-N7 methyltransferase [Chrysothrix sp. TS-e1954]|nr:MAG: mRNA cap guanine-N7 methyltransferase [Chrysothrix sp. TS-e1954]